MVIAGIFLELETVSLPEFAGMSKKVTGEEE
jgi:hypothetical protein